MTVGVVGVLTGWWWGTLTIPTLGEPGESVSERGACDARAGDACSPGQRAPSGSPSGLTDILGRVNSATCIVRTAQGVEIELRHASVPALAAAEWLAWIDRMPEVTT